MKQKFFKPGIIFESGTEYIADKREYHIRLSDCVKVSGHGFAPIVEPLSVAFFLEKLHDVTVDLAGAKLIFHGRIAPFIISECCNIKLKNFSIDYDRPFYTQFDILERDNNGISVRINEEFPYRVENGILNAVSETWVQPIAGIHSLMQPFNRTTMAPANGAECILAAFAHCESENPPMPVRILTAIDCGDIVKIEGNLPESWHAGLTVAATHEIRDKNAILAERSCDITVDNVRLKHCASMGFVGMFCRDITIKKFDMFIDGGERLVSSNADSIHFFHCSGKIDITDCIFENMLDDAINVHGNYSVVTKSTGDKATLAFSAAGLRDLEWYRAGDMLTVYRGRTQEKICDFTVREVSYEGNAVRVHSDKVLGISPGDIVENSVAPDISINRCIVGRNRGRGFLLSGGGKTTVEDCYFHSCDCAIHFTGDTSYWYESGPVKDVTVRDCFFDECCYCGQPFAIVASPDFHSTDKAKFFHHNIRIIDNVFRSFTGGLFSAKYVEGIVFRNNRLIRSDAYPYGGLSPLCLAECGSVDTDLEI